MKKKFSPHMIFLAIFLLVFFAVIGCVSGSQGSVVMKSPREGDAETL